VPATAKEIHVQGHVNLVMKSIRNPPSINANKYVLLHAKNVLRLSIGLKMAVEIVNLHVLVVNKKQLIVQDV